MKSGSLSEKIADCFGSLAPVGGVVNFQVSIMKILASYPIGLAPIANLTRDLVLLAASGPEWSQKTKRMAATSPELDIFGAGLVERYSFGWRLTIRGLEALELMERGARTVSSTSPLRFEETAAVAAGVPVGLIASAPSPSSTDLAVERRSQFAVIDGCSPSGP